MIVNGQVLDLAFKASRLLSDAMMRPRPSPRLAMTVPSVSRDETLAGWLFPAMREWLPRT